MKKIIYLAVSLLFFNAVYSQQYSRLSITPIHLKHSSGALSLVSFSDSVTLSEKYDYNYFGNNTLSVDFPRVSPYAATAANLQTQINNLLKSSSPSPDQLKQLRNDLEEVTVKLKIDDSLRMPKLIQALNNGKIANKILASILIDPSLGYMTTDVIAKRAEYNASDADFVKAMNSETKMAAIRDKGIDLLKNVYFIIFDDNMQTETASEKNPQNKTIGVSSIAYLFQVDIDSLMRTGQFDPLIFTEKDNAKAQAFASFNFPLKFIMIGSAEAVTTNYKLEKPKISGKALLGALSGGSKEPTDLVKFIMKSDEEVSKDLVNGLFSSAEFYFSRKYEPFKVKVPVFGNSPITAKIGKKEAIKIDELYKVTESVLKKDGSKVDKKVGWIRVKKVADNLKNADGKMEPSVFYKVSSKKVERGMKLTQRRQFGTVFGLGFNIGSESDVAAGLMLSAEYISHIYPGVRFGISGGGFLPLKAKEATINGGKEEGITEGTPIYIDATAQKIFQANHLELTPMVGAYLSSVSISKLGGTKVEENYFKGLTNTSYGGLIGIKAGYNFGPHAQINIGYKYGFAFSSSLSKDEANADPLNESTSEIIFNAPSVISIGLRIYGF